LYQLNFLSLLIMVPLWNPFRQITHQCYQVIRYSKFSGPLAPLLIAIVSATAILITTPAMAEKRLSTPGSTWGEIRFPGSPQPEDSDNLILEGAAEQGVDVFSLSKDSKLNFFGRVDYSVDTEALDWNRKLRLGAGVKVRHYLSNTAVIAVGAKYEIDKRFVDDRTMDGFQLFSNWFGSWQLPNSDQGTSAPARPLGFPGLTWGELRYPGSQDPSEDNDLVLEGAVEQGVDWMSLNRWGALNFYGSLDYIVDSKELDWNNSITYGVGVKLKKVVGSNVLLQFGIEAARERRWVSNQTESVIFVYLNWSGWWDPRAIRLDLPE
jgi:hypothetical protein